MLTLSKQTDYGLLFLSLLDKNKLIPLSNLAKKTNLPKRFLARIASKLSKNKIVESREGKNGGYRLTDKVEKINLYQYLRIFEGELELLACEKRKNNCRWQNFCAHKNFFHQKLRKIIIDELKKYKLASLLYEKKSLS